MTSNQHRGAHWTKVRDAREAVAWHVRSAGGDLLPRIDRCHIHITWYAKDRRTRDAGSLTVFGKAVIDALVDLGVLVKDDANHVLSETYSVQLASDHPRITVTIEPVQAEAAA
jgi:Holliday junction resolvase RusA-like endonuclease